MYHWPNLPEINHPGTELSSRRLYNRFPPVTGLFAAMASAQRARTRNARLADYLASRY